VLFRDFCFRLAWVWPFGHSLSQQLECNSGAPKFTSPFSFIHVVHSRVPLGCVLWYVVPGRVSWRALHRLTPASTRAITCYGSGLQPLMADTTIYSAGSIKPSSAYRLCLAPPTRYGEGRRPGRLALAPVRVNIKVSLFTIHSLLVLGKKKKKHSFLLRPALPQQWCPPRVLF